MAGISLNGTTFYPSDIQQQIYRIGVLLESANGDRTWVQRLDGSSNPIRKREWAISWDDVGETVRAAVETIVLLGTTFAFVDVHSVSRTVQCEADDYKESVSYIDGTGAPLYTVNLTIRTP